MTEQLKTLMDRAADVDFAAVDLESITSAGDRTVRRRRIATGIAGIAATAVVLGLVALAGDGGGDGGEAQVADTPVDSDGMSWADGSVLHTPTSSIDLGHPVRAYVRTAAGFVAVDADGFVWSVVGGDVKEVGRMAPSSLYLTSDTEDSLAAWLQPEAGGEWSWVVFDQGLGRRVATFEEGRAGDIVGVVVALDDRTLYVKEGDGYLSLDVDDGDEAVIDRPARNAQLLAVENGILVWSDPDEAGGSSSYLVGRTEMQPVEIAQVQGSQASMSPDGQWVTFDADEPRVFAATTGEQVPIDVDGRIFASGYEWLDEDSVALIASRNETGPIELLVCEVPSGSCRVVAPDLGTFDDAINRGFALPVGTTIDD